MNRERSRDVKKAVGSSKQNQRSESSATADLPSLGPLRRVVRPALQRQPYHRETGRRLLDADAPPPRRALGHSRRQGRVTVNGKQFLLTENQSTFIPIEPA